MKDEQKFMLFIVGTLNAQRFLPNTKDQIECLETIIYDLKTERKLQDMLLEKDSR